MGRACTVNPFLPQHWSRPLSVVDAQASKPAGNWATIRPIPLRPGCAPRVTERDLASIRAAMAAGVPVRRFGPDGKEIA